MCGRLNRLPAALVDSVFARSRCRWHPKRSRFPLICLFGSRLGSFFVRWNATWWRVRGVDRMRTYVRFFSFCSDTNWCLCREAVPPDSRPERGPRCHIAARPDRYRALIFSGRTSRRPALQNLPTAERSKAFFAPNHREGESSARAVRGQKKSARIKQGEPEKRPTTLFSRSLLGGIVLSLFCFRRFVRKREQEGSHGFDHPRSDAIDSILHFLQRAKRASCLPRRDNGLRSRFTNPG